MESATHKFFKLVISAYTAYTAYIISEYSYLSNQSPPEAHTLTSHRWALGGPKTMVKNLTS